MTRRDFSDPRWTVADRSTLAYITDSLARRSTRPNAERAAVHALAADAAHTEAVRRAAATYESIRIHRLTLEGPPAARPAVEIVETLYIDYRTSPPRREMRAA
jgi:hypothetical protein